MAKVKSALFDLSGKLGDKVFAKGRQGTIIKQLPTPNKRSASKAYKAQSGRTKVLNDLASDINRMVSRHGNRLKSNDLYARLLSAMRLQPSNERVLLLRTVQGMETNKKYKFSNLNPPLVTEIKARGNKIQFTLTGKQHAYLNRRAFTCYYYELLLLLWNKKTGACTEQLQRTTWISMEDEVPCFEFIFEKNKDDSEWLVCCRLSLGHNDVAFDELATGGMMILSIGSFDKAAQKLLEQAAKPAERPLKQGAKPQVPLKLVGPKKR